MGRIEWRDSLSHLKGKGPIQAKVTFLSLRVRRTERELQDWSLGSPKLNSSGKRLFLLQM